MYIVLFIFAMISFICSFIPIVGIAGTVTFAIVSIILSLVSLKKSDSEISKKQKEASIISLVITIAAIIICVVVNIIAVKYSIDFIKSFTELGENLGKDYISTIENLEQHSIGEQISLDDGNFKITVNDVLTDGDLFIVNVMLESINENKNISLYDFYLYNLNNGEIYYPKYEVGGDFAVKEEIASGKSKQKNIKFKIENYSSNEELYLVFSNGDNKIKIKI